MQSTTNEWSTQALKSKLEIHKTSGVVGIDVAKNKHFATILDPLGQTIVPPFSFSNSKEGFDALADKINQMGTLQGIRNWLVGFEASGGYEKPLAAFLKENQFDVVQVDSFAVKRQREMINRSFDKNDAKDCLSIAYLIRQGYVSFYHCRSLEEEKLSGLVLINEHLKKRRSQLKIKIKQNSLKYLFPELEGFCKNIESPFVLDLLSLYPTPQDIVSATKLEFKKTMLPRLKGRKVSFYLDELFSLAENSIGLKIDRWDVKALELRTYVEELRVIEGQRDIIAKRIGHLLEVNPQYQLISTIPGIAQEIGAALLAEIGDINRFGNERQLLSFAGLDLVNHQSGNYTGTPRLSKRGRPLIRKVTFQAVNVSILCTKSNPIAVKYRQIVATQGDTKDVRQKAKIKLCAKLLRMVYAVLKNQEPYRDSLADQA